MITLKKLTHRRYDVFHAQSGAYMGDLSILDDSFQWLPNIKSGEHLTSVILHSVAKELDRLNDEWSKRMDESSHPMGGVLNDVSPPAYSLNPRI